MTRKHSLTRRLTSNIKKQAKLNNRRLKRAAGEHTERYLTSQDAAREDAVQKIMVLGYTERRARRAVEEYDTATAQTRLTPDWDGFLKLVASFGFADD